jgi:hypothetical protein
MWLLFAVTANAGAADIKRLAFSDFKVAYNGFVVWRGGA